MKLNEEQRQIVADVRDWLRGEIAHPSADFVKFNDYQCRHSLDEDCRDWAGVEAGLSALLAAEDLSANDERETVRLLRCLKDGAPAELSIRIITLTWRESRLEPDGVPDF
jgi:hypothetical protein